MVERSTGRRSPSPAEALRIVSQAWGKQRGWAFFPTIRGDAQDKKERIRSYREGEAYKWPEQREDVLLHLNDHVHDDVYWCPNLFEYPRRRTDFAMDERALWADLDSVDPRSLEDYPPTVAWETSPGRYQALWLLSSSAPSFMGASWSGCENHRMTALIGADPGGWDSTQLLRLPGWVNHKPEYREKYGEWRGKLVWDDWRDRPRYFPDDFSDLPETGAETQFEEVLEAVVDGIDAKALWSKIRLKLPSRTRQLYKGKAQVGIDRSEVMWGIERDMADAGLNAAEIVALMRECDWNKFQGRQDEFRRLAVEAGKALAMRPDVAKEVAEEEREAAKRMEPREIPDMITLFTNLRRPRWLVKDIWTEGACGFIAGQPKLHKSWVAFDLGLSVATGRDFLGAWKVVSPGPVMYVQEEDPAPELKRRFEIMWPSKRADRVTRDDAGELWWEPPADMSAPDVAGVIGQGIVLSDPEWQDWLDEAIGLGFHGTPYKMVVLDPLLMMLGDVDDNKAPIMNEQVFKPLKQLAAKHGTAVCVVHHMRKGQLEGRGGQMMLGSVANHAWSQDALYLGYGKGGVLDVERESKSAPYLKFKIRQVTDQPNSWTPRITNVRGLWDEDSEFDEDDRGVVPERRKPKRKGTNLNSDTVRMVFLSSPVVSHGGLTTNQVIEMTGLGRMGVIRRLKLMQGQGSLKRSEGKWYPTDDFVKSAGV